MPCGICKLAGHNARTCTAKCTAICQNNASQEILTNQIKNDEETPSEKSKEKKKKRFYCYILAQTKFLTQINQTPRRTYNGYTVDLRHRLRQHNGDIKGGAFATRNRGPWEFIAVMTCPEWTNIRAMQVEWLIRYPTRKKPRPHEFGGAQGRINSLVEVVERMTEPLIHLYVNPLFYNVVNLPDKVKLFNSIEDVDF